MGGECVSLLCVLAAAAARRFCLLICTAPLSRQSPRILIEDEVHVKKREK